MNMISSTSTTSTSGVMLIAALIGVGSPSRISPFLFDRWRLDLSRFDVHLLELRYFEQAGHAIGRRPIASDRECLHFGGDVGQRSEHVNCHRDTQERRE